MKARLRTALRWTTAVLVLGAVGAGTAYAVTVPRRTDVPGLATKPDDRYTFTGVAAPAPPAGSPAPGDQANQAGAHYGDLRRFLLPAPKGATLDPAGPGDPYDTAAVVAAFGGNSLHDQYFQYGARWAAKQSWTTPDGTHTAVYLVQFPDATAASKVDESSAVTPAGFDDAADASTDPKVEVQVPQLDNAGTMTFTVDVMHYRTVRKGGSPTDPALPGKVGRFAHFCVGDTVVYIVTTAPAAATDVPFEQIVYLQAAMLR